MKLKIILLLVIVMISGMTGTASAAMQRRQAADNQNDGSARLQQMMRKLALERDRLKAENAVLTKNLDTLNKEDKKLKSKLKKNKSKLTRSKKRNLKYKDRVNLYANKIRELVNRLRQSLTTLGQAKVTISDQTGELLSCMNYNIKLFDAGSEMLSKYEEKGVWDALLQAEPLTQLKQVEIENVIEDYRYKMLELEVLAKAEDVKNVKNIADEVISKTTTNGNKTVDNIESNTTSDIKKKLAPRKITEINENNNIVKNNNTNLVAREAALTPVINKDKINSNN